MQKRNAIGPPRIGDITHPATFFTFIILMSQLTLERCRFLTYFLLRFDSIELSFQFIPLVRGRVRGLVHSLLSLLLGLAAGANWKAYQYKNLISKQKHYQLRVQGHIKKRTEKAEFLEDIFHTHGSVNPQWLDRTRGLKQVLQPCVHSSFISETGSHANSDSELLA